MPSLVNGDPMATVGLSRGTIYTQRMSFCPNSINPFSYYTINTIGPRLCQSEESACSKMSLKQVFDMVLSCRSSLNSEFVSNVTQFSLWECVAEV